MEEKKNTRGRFLLSLLVSSLIAFVITLNFEKGDSIQFKRIELEENDYFIHIEPYEGMLHVPQVNFYSSDGKIVGSTQAK